MFASVYHEITCYITHLRDKILSMSTTQSAKKRGTPSDFRGACAQFLGQWSEEYAEASRKKALAKFWPRIFPQYWMNFPWHMELTEEPVGPLFIDKDAEWVAPVSAKEVLSDVDVSRKSQIVGATQKVRRLFSRVLVLEYY